MRPATQIAAALILLATALAAQTARQIIRVGPDRGRPFSPAVKAGGFVYVSGTLATDDEGRVVPGDIKVQTRKVLDKISEVLKAAGSRLDRSASVYVYLKSAADFQAMNEAYREVLTRAFPARATVESGLVNPDGLVEIMFTAVK